MTHAEHALAGLADNGKSLGQQVIERFAISMALPEFVGLGLELSVIERRDLRLQRIDALDGLGVLLDQPVIAAAENLLEYCGCRKSS